MGRLHKLDAGVELEIIHNHQSQHNLTALSCGYPNGLIYDGYGKEYYFGKCAIPNPISDPNTQP